MRYWLMILSLTTLIILGCQDSKPPIQDAKKTDSLHFFSIAGFIQSQIMDVDLHNYQIQLTETLNGKANKKNIDKDRFGLIAKQFYPPLLEAATFEQNFTEQIFQDESTNSIILHYQAKHHQSIPFVDILLDADSHLVKRLFFKELIESPTSQITNQYSWKSNREFQINSSSQSLNGDTSIRYLQVSWNPINQNH